ncbi:DUF192 domain-containing protein [Aurantiacibacter spongiae]|uniref:DUF192 domain-containing protein n=1 Tax=Aurantiacibacter spongiae TaxID=2488860 RepID=A0A3N5CPZ1_9SPHN|nr:DUF192 domain-containing protein [Aurantiacibacter spongiae]RPF71074.1 DUF192 domain-containing protein [Aurantiacibacter spongiae]
MRRTVETSVFHGVILALAAGTLAACSPQSTRQVAEPGSTSSPPVHPRSGLEIVPVTITANDEDHTIAAEVAATREAQSRGLMFRTELGPDEGMLFLYDQPRILSFWMRNTVLPLDLIFIDATRRVINIGHGEPYNETSITSNRPGIAVLELNAGRAAELGLEPGDTIDW